MTTTIRRVLLLTTDDDPASPVETALVDAGYEIRHCFTSRSPSFPCVGLAEGGTCPLDDKTVDVVVDVRQHPWPRPTPRESGVLCALRDDIPLVVAGRTAFHPYDGWAQVTLEGADGIVDACEVAIDRSLTRHRDAMLAAVAAVIAGHDVPHRDIAVEVRRSCGEVHATIDAALPIELRSIVAARVGAALRRVDRTAARIEVDLTDSGA